jgi:hypothetical protein
MLQWHFGLVEWLLVSELKATQMALPPLLSGFK